MSAAIDIADPRIFPDAAHAKPEDAAAYALAVQSLAAATVREADRLRRALRADLASRLRADQGSLASLFVAMPSVDTARVIWRELDAAWRDAVVEARVGVTVFAVPLVVVVGGADGKGGELRGTIDDPAALADVLREHGALRGNRTIALADALASPDALDIGRLPEVLGWHAEARHARAVAPAPLDYAAGRESVHARLVVGSAIGAAAPDLLDAPPRGGWAMAFTRELVRGLHAPGASVLALPAAPAWPLQAVREARAAQRDVAAQVFASNALRGLRSASGEPVAVLSAHRAHDAPGGGELRLSLSSVFDERDAHGFRCPLYPLDRAGDVAAMLVTLLSDCRVEDVRVVPGVHAERVAGSAQPLFFRHDTIPPGLH